MIKNEHVLQFHLLPTQESTRLPFKLTQSFLISIFMCFFEHLLKVRLDVALFRG